MMPEKVEPDPRPSGTGRRRKTAPPPRPGGPLLAIVDEQRTERMSARAQNNRQTLSAAAADISAAAGSRERIEDRSPVDVAVRALRELGFEVSVPPGTHRSAEPMADLLRANGIRTRRVEFDGPSTTPVIGFTTDGRPVAVPPGRVAVDLAPFGLAVYRSLPHPLPALRGLVGTALQGSGRDFLQLAVTGLLAAGVAIGIPVTVGIVVSWVVGSGSHRTGWWLAGLLVIMVAAGSMFLLARNAAVIRLQGRLQAQLEPSVWNHLLRLDTGFFAQFSTGQLVQRANAIAAARRNLSDVAINALVGAVFSVVSLAVLFTIDVRLALFVAVGVGILLLALILLGRRQQRHETEVFRLYGDVYGFLYQALVGIDKIQLAGREIQVFARWAELFGRQKRADAAALRSSGVATALLTTAQPMLLVLLITGIEVFGPTPTVGAIAAVATAIGQVVLALGQVGAVMAAAYSLAPVLERLQPILRATPENTTGGKDPGPLSGRLVLDEVSYSYPGTTGRVLESVTLAAEPGEMIAIVGPSGAGKSTIVRMLLGFDRPESGHVLLDGQDLAALDLHLVRRQLGVVLQNSRISGSSILDVLTANVPGATEIDAWEAVARAGLEEEFRRLPMQLDTRLTDGSPSFSGGQMQRLLIARALVKRPPMLIFDEATSALDNAVQRRVSDGIAALACTRVVVAHRMSTIARADRIYVLERGRITASGTYQELLAGNEFFFRLARRQEI